MLVSDDGIRSQREKLVIHSIDNHTPGLGAQVIGATAEKGLEHGVLQKDFTGDGTCATTNNPTPPIVLEYRKKDKISVEKINSAIDFLSLANYQQSEQFHLI